MNANEDEIDKLLAVSTSAEDARFTFRVMAALPPRKEPHRWAKLLPAAAAITSVAVATMVTGANGFGLRLAEAFVEPSTTLLAAVLGISAASWFMFVSATR